MIYFPIIIFTWCGTKQTKIYILSIVTSDFVYLRLTGDRSIGEKDSGKIQKDRIEEIKRWEHKIFGCLLRG